MFRRRINNNSDRLIEELFWCVCGCNSRRDRFDRCDRCNRRDCFDRCDRCDRFR